MKLVFCYAILDEFYSTKYTSGKNLVQEPYAHIPLTLFAQCTQFLNIELNSLLKEKGFTEATTLVVGNEIANINEVYNALLLRSFVDMKADAVLLIDVTRDIPPEINIVVQNMFRDMDFTKEGIVGFPEYGVYLVPKSVIFVKDGFAGINFENIKKDYLSKESNKEVTVH